MAQTNPPPCIMCLAFGECPEHEPAPEPTMCAVCRQSEAVAMAGPEPVCDECLGTLAADEEAA